MTTERQFIGRLADKHARFYCVWFYAEDRRQAMEHVDQIVREPQFNSIGMIWTDVRLADPVVPMDQAGRVIELRDGVLMTRDSGRGAAQ